MHYEVKGVSKYVVIGSFIVILFTWGLLSVLFILIDSCNESVNKNSYEYYMKGDFYMTEDPCLCIYPDDSCADVFPLECEENGGQIISCRVCCQEIDETDSVFYSDKP